MADLEADLGLGGHVCEVIPKRHKQKSGGSETEKGEKPKKKNALVSRSPLWAAGAQSCWDPLRKKTRILRPGGREAGTFIPPCLKAPFKIVNLHTSAVLACSQTELPGPREAFR